MYLWRELTRALFSFRALGVWASVLTLLAFALVTLYGLETEPPPGDWDPAFRNAYEAWLMAQDGLVLLAPLAAPALYADTLVVERRWGFTRYVLVRMGWRRYIRTKLLVNAVAGAWALMVPAALFFGYTSWHFTRALPAWEGTVYSLEQLPCNTESFLCEELYPAFPDAYIAARIGLYGLFGMVMATLGMALSVFTTNRYVPLIGPYLVHMFLGYLLIFSGLEIYSPVYILVPDGISGTNLWTVGLPLFFIGAGSLMVLWFGLRRQEIFFL